LFYTIAVLGTAMRETLGVSEVALHGAYSAGLLVSGLLAPAVGRRIDAHGGRGVLATGSVLAALACTALAAVQGPVTLVAAWLLAGVAMAMTLYDPAFATLHHVAGLRYRTSVTALTLFGGFASTVFWPLSQWLLEQYGFRVAFVAYAAVHLAVCLPLHRLCVPDTVAPRSRSDDVAPVAPAWEAHPSSYVWLAGALVFVGFATSAISAHLVTLLTAGGLGMRDAVLVGTLFGPMQVAGRLMEFAFARRVSAIAAGTIAFAVLAVALVLLTQVRDGFATAALFAALYGFANGVLTIVRGTVPAELFGRHAYGALLGRLARPQLVARAAAPLALAAVIAIDPDRNLAPATLAIGGVLAFLAYRRAVQRGGQR
jgi:predicted MFS family arabinose efflux permease